MAEPGKSESCLDKLKTLFGRSPTKLEIASHLADSISAQEKIQGIARRDGDPGLLEQATSQIKMLRGEAKQLGFDPNDYPGLFR